MPVCRNCEALDNPEPALAVRMIYSYFISSSIIFSRFLTWISSFLEIKHLTVDSTLDLIRAHYAARKQSASLLTPPFVPDDLGLYCSVPVVLLIDEMLNCGGVEPAQRLEERTVVPTRDSPPVLLLQTIGRLMDHDGKFFPVATAMDPCFPTLVSHRTAFPLELRTLSLEDSVYMFSQLRLACSFEDAITPSRQKLLNLLILEANGYPRHLKLIHEVLTKHFRFGEPVKFGSIMSEIVKGIMADSSQNLGLVAIALGIIGYPVPLTFSLPPAQLTIKQLIRSGHYLQSGNLKSENSAQYIPLLAGLHARCAIASFTDPRESLPADFSSNVNFRKSWNQAYKSFSDGLQSLLKIEASFDLVSPDEPCTNSSERGFTFESYHGAFEALRACALFLCAPFLPNRDAFYCTSLGVITESLTDHFHLSSCSDNRSWRIFCDSERHDLVFSPKKRYSFQQHFGHSLLSTDLVWPLTRTLEDVTLPDLLNHLSAAASDPTAPSYFTMVRSNVGFDAVQLLRESVSGKLWCLIIQLKYSQETGSIEMDSQVKPPTLPFGHKYTKKAVSYTCQKVFANTELRRKLHQLHVAKTFLVVAAWRNLGSDFDSRFESDTARFPLPDLEENDDCCGIELLVLARPALEKFYASLSPFAGMFAGDCNKLNALFDEARDRSASGALSGSPTAHESSNSSASSTRSSWALGEEELTWGDLQ